MGINQTVNFNKNNSILIVNKSDLINDGNDETAMNIINELTNNLGINYIITSAKNNVNVKNSFYKLIESIYDTMFADKMAPSSSSSSSSSNNANNLNQFYLNAVLDRGQTMDNLLDRSVDLSASSRTFYKRSKKSSGCC